MADNQARHALEIEGKLSPRERRDNAIRSEDGEELVLGAPDLLLPQEELVDMNTDARKSG